MNKSNISKAILMSAAALASGAFLPAAQAGTQDSALPTSKDTDGEHANFLDFDQFRDSVRDLQEMVAVNPDFRARYVANPREVLTEAGLPANLQLEMMREDGLSYGAAFKNMDCICTQTCLKTN